MFCRGIRGESTWGLDMCARYLGACFWFLSFSFARLACQQSNSSAGSIQRGSLGIHAHAGPGDVGRIEEPGSALSNLMSQEVGKSRASNHQSATRRPTCVARLKLKTSAEKDEMCNSFCEPPCSDLFSTDHERRIARKISSEFADIMCKYLDESPQLMHSVRSASYVPSLPTIVEENEFIDEDSPNKRRCSEISLQNTSEQINHATASSESDYSRTRTAYSSEEELNFDREEEQTGSTS